jgi:hypothetical protein
MRNRLLRVSMLLLFMLCACRCVSAADAPVQKACRSIHLGFAAPEGTAYYNEMTIEKSADGTYFMAAGFSKGYFGLQQLGNGKKVVLFSVWDPGKQNDKNAVDQDNRVKLLYHDDDVRIGRFGGEGTGGQSFLDYDWKIGTTYRFLVTAKVEDARRTAFAGYFYIPEKKAWKHLVTFSTLTGGKALSGYYSFIEDFRRNTISATQIRRATYGPAWIKSAKDGSWLLASKAKFTGDNNPAMNINAGIDTAAPGKFFLQTGGDTTNSDTPLWKTLETPDAKKVKLPEDLAEILDKKE